jgi:hypothetical protein
MFIDVVLPDVEVLYVDSDAGIPGAVEAFRRLEAPLPTLKGRRFYGVVQGDAYRACVARTPDDDPAGLGLATWVIPGGKYRRARIRDWAQHTAEIGPAFDALRAPGGVDPARPGIEFYRSQAELLVHVPVR